MQFKTAFIAPLFWNDDMKIEIRNLNISFGKGKQILKDLSLTCDGGKCIGILGGNGSGKSTLFSILAGILKPDSGEFFCNGVNLFEDKKRRSELMGYVPQTPPLLDELTARDNLMMWYSKEKLEKSLNSGFLSALGISNFIRVPVHKMSGGMKKRLAIGCAVSDSPKILLFDEPSAALDLVCKQIISDYIKKFKSSGNIVLLATHDVQELYICDEHYILKDGHLEAFSFDGDVRKLAEKLS